MTDPMVGIMAMIRVEFVNGIIQPEQVRAFIHPRLDSPVIIYRSPDEVAEADAVNAERRKGESHG